MGSIYKLSDGELNYYGSTNDLNKRFNEHKCKANKCSSNQLNKDALYIEVVEVVEDAKQLLIRERWFIDNNKCVNTRLPYLTTEEAETYQRDYHKNYYNKNNTHSARKEYYKQYYQKQKLKKQNAL